MVKVMISSRTKSRPETVVVAVKAVVAAATVISAVAVVVAVANPKPVVAAVQSYKKKETVEIRVQQVGVPQLIIWHSYDATQFGEASILFGPGQRPVQVW